MGRDVPCNALRGAKNASQPEQGGEA